MAKPPAFFYFDLGNVLLDFDHRRAAQHMAAVAQVPPDIPLAAAAQMMRDKHLRAVFLMHNASGIIYPAAMLTYTSGTTISTTTSGASQLCCCPARYVVDSANTTRSER